MNALLRVPDEGPHFEGHFPGRPILPGVALLALVAAALDRGAIRRIAHARFRSVVGPGERLSMDAQRVADDALRIALRRDRAVVMDAEVGFTAPESAPRVPPDAAPEPASDRAPRAAGTADPSSDVAPLDALLPHRPPMRFVTGVLGEHHDGADCAACVPAGCALVTDGFAPALAVIEAAAQTAAVWEALRRSRAGGGAGPRQGYLVALRDVVLYRACVPAAVALAARVRLEAAAMPLTRYRAEVRLDGEVVMAGRVATVLA
jgi:3-hydroxymyristoyl/3-hydroxydecanoyl-(acyl carrier protein) dehydratase